MQFSKKTKRASRVSIHLQDKVNQLLDRLEQYQFISPVKKVEQPKGNTFLNHFIILANGKWKIIKNSSRRKISQFTH